MIEIEQLPAGNWQYRILVRSEEVARCTRPTEADARRDAREDDKLARLFYHRQEEE